jgi:hypothetical protein
MKNIAQTQKAFYLYISYLFTKSHDDVESLNLAAINEYGLNLSVEGDYPFSKVL